MTEQERIAAEKVRFLDYFTDVPIQKYAAMHIGKSEDTISRWKGEDTEFADQIEAKKADYLRRSVTRIRLDDPKWIIERIYKKDFSVRRELTGAEGNRLLPSVIKDLETDNEKLADEIGKQGLENDTPVQDQGQTGESGSIPAESDTSTPSPGEAGTQPGSNPQG